MSSVLALHPKQNYLSKAVLIWHGLKHTSIKTMQVSFFTEERINSEALTVLKRIPINKTEQKLGLFIKDLRKNRNITIGRFALLLEKNEAEVAYIEEGIIFTEAADLQRIAIILETPINNFYDYVKDATSLGALKRKDVVMQNISKFGTMLIVREELIERGNDSSLISKKSIKSIFSS